MHVHKYYIYSTYTGFLVVLLLLLLLLCLIYHAMFIMLLSSTTRKQALGPPKKHRYGDETVPNRYWFISIPVHLGWMEFMNEP